MTASGAQTGPHHGNQLQQAQLGALEAHRPPHRASSLCPVAEARFERSPQGRIFEIAIRRQS